ncbi:MAG: acetate--CoA ligase family protein, partial [Pseudomonadota bacterium]
PFSASDGSMSMRDTSGVADAIVKFADGVSDQVTFFIDVPRPGAGELDKVWCDSLEALIEVREKLGVPVSVAGILPEGLPEGFRFHMHENGVASLLGFSETMEALAISIGLSANRAKLLETDELKALLNGTEIIDTGMLDEAASKQALEAFGLMTPGYEAVPLDEAGAAAERLGYPVALKVLSNTIAHKAKLGGVKLGLNSSEEVSEAAKQMAADVGSAQGGHEVTHVLVEKMVSGANAEIIIGIKRHPALGLALMIGRGGSQAEEMARFETVLLPLTNDDLDRTFETLSVNHHPAIDELRKNCEAVASYAIANTDKLVTLDVNPVMLTEDGQAVATDALIVLGKD